MTQALTKIVAKNFRSLKSVEVPLSPLTVLVGPNGAGKSNLLKVLSFVRDAARLIDVDEAIAREGGFERIQRQDGNNKPVHLELHGLVTSNSSESALDSYEIRLTPRKGRVSRAETLQFKRTQGPGRRLTISVSRDQVSIADDQSQGNASPHVVSLASTQTSGLGTIARLGSTELGEAPREFFDFLSSIRYLDPDVNAAKQPARKNKRSALADDASNLAATLLSLKTEDEDSFNDLIRDLKQCLPGLEGIDMEEIGGASRSVVVRLREAGISTPLELADASFGTVRMLSLLAALHDPMPPKLTIIEEIDHGLHPYALDVLIERMRVTSKRTQLIIASHSPTFVNRLEPSEIVICDRDPETGASIIPARNPEELAQAIAATDLGLGELWFSGTVGGVPL